ncbi:hypothetical protein [Sorangium cellulosum]|uniref:Lipoprotein n=1 Tax=Sorangium cellulosum So0157-2 TaxID=1254432 RepID=S4XP16_SORCE|nr:hypothetical protein [Sorangium cellulosum]AGP33525.1 hypothetical protein SCE1572_02790 [Sorangium cellulosum So0157-2]
MMRVFHVLPLSLAALGALACSSTPEPTIDPSNPCPPGQWCASAVPTTTATTVPTTTATAAPAGTAATPIPPVAAVAATPVLQGMGATEAPGMKADGGPFAGQFQEGQTLEQDITISAGKCYTVVGIGIGVQELDLQLVSQPAPGLPPVVLAQDSTTGAAATLGGKASGCWKNPLPIGGPGKVILKATKGTGIAAAQVFSK